ncbi:MAG: DNA gyrase subunit A [Sarcina sp.]
MANKKEIIDILQEEFIDYAAPIIVNNLPSIDGLLPVNRKVIWGMYKAKATHDKPFIKMLRASGYVLPYYIFGDMPLTNAMKNMGNNTLNHMYLEPKGSFGDKRRKEANGASARYIECKLSAYSEQMLRGINKNNVPMKMNYDLTEQEPIILPSIMPNILVNNSESIAVGESSKIPSHNMIDVCNSFINYIETQDIDKSIELIKGIDVPTYGKLIYNKVDIDNIYKTGRGSFTLLGNYKYDEDEGKFTIMEVPYGSYIEDIEKKIRENYEKDNFKEIIDIHDSTDKDGIKLDIYLKKSCNLKLFIKKLCKYTPFKSSLSCNFTILDLDGKTPVLMSLEDIICKWTTHRINCIKAEMQFDIDEKNKRLERLRGLILINSDLDQAIKIIRESKKEKLALEELIKYFKLSNEQAEYVSTIKLVNINEEWIAKQIKNIDILLLEMEGLLADYNNEDKIKTKIIEQLLEVQKKWGKPRKTEILYDFDSDLESCSIIEDYNCRVLYTNNYIKKHLKFSDNHKLKEDEIILGDIESNNKDTLMVITNKANRYKVAVNNLDTVTPSSYGQYIPSLIELEEGEKIVKIISVSSDRGDIVAVYKNGKIAKIGIKSFLSANKKLVGCYNQESELLDIQYVEKDTNVFLLSSNGKGLIINTKDLNTKVSRNTQGVTGIKLKDDDICVGCKIGITKDCSFNLHTTNDREIYIHMDNVSANENKNIFDYISGRVANQGNHIFYSSSKNVKVDRVEFK